MSPKRDHMHWPLESGAGCVVSTKLLTAGPASVSVSRQRLWKEGPGPVVMKAQKPGMNPWGLRGLTSCLCKRGPTKSPP